MPKVRVYAMEKNAKRGPLFLKILQFKKMSVHRLKYLQNLHLCLSIRCIFKLVKDSWEERQRGM